MGGLSQSDWHLDPERNSILIGTQDMLLSRALNRGYGTGRARWPMEYALLNVDCLWVMDEIQLMGVGLVTSAQLQAFADHEGANGRLPRPRRTWWMSATLQHEWLSRANDFAAPSSVPLVDLDVSEKSGPLWDLSKTLRVVSCPDAEDPKAQRWTDVILEAHSRTAQGLTLVIANTVKSASAIHDAIARRKKDAHQLSGVELRLVHSRFRGEERRKWAEEFLQRQKCGNGANRIIVATQVVEAGVDISANALVTELAPWPSLVQRFGRCARYGGSGEVIVVDRRHTADSAKIIRLKENEDVGQKRRSADRSIALPYDLEDVEAAAEALSTISNASPASLANIAITHPDLLPRLFPYEPLHVLTRRELRDLFDTGPDLSGADVDISRFVRDGNERDITVWWWPVPPNEQPHPRLRPAHDALCRVPIEDAEIWLKGKRRDADGAEGDGSNGGVTEASSIRAWAWSYLDGGWERLHGQRLYPGLTVLIDANAGGYDTKVGFKAKALDVPVLAEHARILDTVEAADAADGQDDLSEGVVGNDRQYKTIATHGFEVAVQALEVSTALAIDDLPRGSLAGAPISKLLTLSGLGHDIGKAHPAFAGAIRERNNIPSETPLAKAPQGRWHQVQHAYDHGTGCGKRPSFRHELASALALLELMWRSRPEHPALHGGREQVLDMTVGREVPAEQERVGTTNGFVTQLLQLDALSFDLVVYLVLAHHGKVRATMPMSPRDQDNPGPLGDLPIRGVRDGDVLPAITLIDAAGRPFDLPDLTLRLEPAKLGLSRRYGPSWVERVLALRNALGDFHLAWLETLLRVADVRASRIDQPVDPRLPAHLAVVPASVSPITDRNADLKLWINSTLATYNDKGNREGDSNAKDKKAQGASRARKRKGQNADDGVKS
jgi:CRISPR-associated endonuclease/helicase Cas3